jgi:hypothetical protein
MWQLLKRAPREAQNSLVQQPVWFRLMGWIGARKGRAPARRGVCDRARPLLPIFHPSTSAGSLPHSTRVTVMSSSLTFTGPIAPAGPAISTAAVPAAATARASRCAAAAGQGLLSVGPHASGVASASALTRRTTRAARDDRRPALGTGAPVRDGKRWRGREGGAEPAAARAPACRPPSPLGLFPPWHDLAVCPRPAKAPRDSMVSQDQGPVDEGLCYS